jgi:hypothetical protein
MRLSTAFAWRWNSEQSDVVPPKAMERRAAGEWVLRRGARTWPKAGYVTPRWKTSAKPRSPPGGGPIPRPLRTFQTVRTPPLARLAHSRARSPAGALTRGRAHSLVLPMRNQGQVDESWDASAVMFD